MNAGRIVVRLATIVVVVLAISTAGFMWELQRPPALPAQPASAVAPATLLVAPIADATPNAGQLRRGQYLVRLGDCLSCHLAPGGQPFAGGLGLNTPFGIIYSSNITSDPTTGIGAWTPEQFFHAMHEGKGPRGHLYPAFPYPWFTHLERADDDAILAYLKTTPPVQSTPPPNRLVFPLGFRGLVTGWNLLFLHPSALRDDPNQSAAWNRGAWIVNGLGHCSACHTPRNALGADKSGKPFRGGLLEDFVAPDLTANPRSGLGSWSTDDIAEYLKSGRNAHSGAAGPMADVITDSTAMMTDADRLAIATYLKSLPASDEVSSYAPDAAAMKRGAAIFSDVCASCHLENGVGQPRFFPPLGHDAVVQQRDPTTVLHLILAGGRVGPSPTRPSPLAMPSFAWKLDDQEVADVATFLRNSFDNRAPSVDPTKVRRLRLKLGLGKTPSTDRSGDRRSSG